MENIKLVYPCVEYSEQYVDVLEEYKSINEKPTFGLHFEYDNFDEIIDEINNLKKGIKIPAWQVQRDIYWLVSISDKRIIGVINIREISTEYFIKVGGNIGYGIRPSERRKGYATKILSLALEKCRKKGHNRVMVTCESDNIASEKTIIKNGGIFDSEIVDDGVTFLRYWIAL